MRVLQRLAAGVDTAVALTAMPAAGVLGGTFDSTNRFSDVVFITVDGQPWCSGTLYRTSRSQTTSNLVMTAAHCTSGVTEQFRVTFDPSPGASSVYYPGTAYSHPDWKNAGSSITLSTSRISPTWAHGRPVREDLERLVLRRLRRAELREGHEHDRGRELMRARAACAATTATPFGSIRPRR
jgi:hypothetical protein